MHQIYKCKLCEYSSDQYDLVFDHVVISHQMGLKLDVATPKLSVEEQLHARSRTGKCAMFWFNPDGTAVTWWTGMSYMEKLFLEDSFRARREWEIKRSEEEDG